VQDVISREKTRSPSGWSLSRDPGRFGWHIIPDSAQLKGTVRSYDETVRQRLLDGVRRTATPSRRCQAHRRRGSSSGERRFWWSMTMRLIALRTATRPQRRQLGDKGV